MKLSKNTNKDSLLITLFKTSAYLHCLSIRTAFILIIISAFIFPYHVFSQTEFYSDYEKGKEAYLNSMYDRALTHFENALKDSSPEYRAVLNYWKGRSHLALGSLSKAENTFDIIIKNYPGTLESQNSLYQKGRISFKKMNMKMQ